MKKQVLATALAFFWCTPVAFAHYDSHTSGGEYTPPRVIDNTGGRSGTYYDSDTNRYYNSNTNRSYYNTYPYMNPNVAKYRVDTRRVSNRSREAYRNETVVELKGDRYCDWVTHFDRYYDGYGWVDYERIVRECDQADGYIRYYGRDARRNARYTKNSYNNYDSYRWSDGVQTFNTYGW